MHTPSHTAYATLAKTSRLNPNTNPNTSRASPLTYAEQLKLQTKKKHKASKDPTSFWIDNETLLKYPRSPLANAYQQSLRETSNTVYEKAGDIEGKAG